MKARAVLFVMLFAVPARAELEPVVARPNLQPRMFPRRWFELSVYASGAVGDCREVCDDTSRWGYAAGFSAAMRPSVGVAAVFTVQRVWFRWLPEGRDPLTAHVTSYRMGIRAYLLEARQLDFWFEQALLVPSWGASTEVSSPYSSPIFGLGLGSAIGAEVFVSHHVKVGARVQVDYYGGWSGPESGGTSDPAQEPLSPPPVSLAFLFGPAVAVVFGPQNIPATE